MSRRFYALQELFLGYSHPDWALDDRDSLDVIRRFRRESDPRFVDAVIGELDELLAVPMSEEELHEHMLKNYSLFYDPWKDELTMREWLTRAMEVLRADSAA